MINVGCLLPPKVDGEAEGRELPANEKRPFHTRVGTNTMNCSNFVRVR